MIMTAHAIKRQRTRGIGDAAIELALIEGEPIDRNPDRLLLTREMMWDAVRRDVLTADQARMLEKSVPLVVVASGAHVVTVLRPTHRISAAKRGPRRARRSCRFTYSES